MNKEIEVDPVFKLFAFGSKSAYLFESIAVHPDGYLYLEPILGKDSLTLDHAASSGQAKFDADYLYRTLNRTPDAGNNSNLGVGIIFFPTPNSRLDTDKFKVLYEVFKADINTYLATDGLPGLVGCNISNQDYIKTLNLINAYVIEITEVCVEARNFLNESVNTDKPISQVKTSEKLRKILKSVDWIELSKIVKEMIKFVMRN